MMTIHHGGTPSALMGDMSDRYNPPSPPTAAAVTYGPPPPPVAPWAQPASQTTMDKSGLPPGPWVSTSHPSAGSNEEAGDGEMLSSSTSN